MKLHVLFGVKGADLEVARHWVEKATGLEAEARESSHLGGDYYRFPPFDPAGDFDAQRVRLVTNRDLYDGEPVFDAPSRWVLALSIEGAHRESRALRGLEEDTLHFKKLSEKSY